MAHLFRVIGRRKHRSLKISNPILIPDLSDMNPFLAARSPVQSVSPQLNPPASIDGLLRAYGVQQGQASSHIHPPPACPTFPPGHKCRTSRVHVRPRPRSARPVSRGSTKSSPATSRPLSRSSSNEAAESLRQARAYISTDSCACNEVVGPSSLHEETEPPPLCLSTPISWSRPVSISDPTIPEVRTRTAIVQVVSQGTQTDAPLPPPKMRTRATNTSVDLSVNTPNPLETPKPRPRNARKSRNRERQSAIPSEATPPRSSESRGDESPTSHLNVVSPGISFSTPDYSTRSPRWDGHEIAPDDDHLSLHQVETIAESMDQYYLARQRDIARRNSHVPHEMSGETNRIDVFRRGRAPAPQYRGSLPSPAIERSPVERGVNGQFLSAGIRNGGQVSGRKNSFDDLQRDEPLFKETTAKASEKQSDRHHHRRDATVKRFRDPSSSQSSQPEFTASLFTPNYPPTPRNSLSAPSSTADAAHPNHTPISYHNVPVAARVSGGPLSLTADRYRGAKTPVSPTSRPSVVVTNRHQRVGLSMDTARSVSGASESELSTVIRRDSFGNIWHSQRDDSSYWRGMHVE